MLRPKRAEMIAPAPGLPLEPNVGPCPEDLEHDLGRYGMAGQPRGDNPRQANDGRFAGADGDAVNEHLPQFIHHVPGVVPGADGAAPEMSTI